MIHGYVSLPEGTPSPRRKPRCPRPRRRGDVSFINKTVTIQELIEHRRSIYIYIAMYICIYIYCHVYIIYICIYIYIHRYIYIHVYLSVYVYTQHMACTYAYPYMYICICVLGCLKLGTPSGIYCCSLLTRAFIEVSVQRQAHIHLIFESAFLYLQNPSSII